MTTQRKVEIAAVIIMIALLALFLRGWQLEREARIHAEDTASANETLAQERADAIKDRDAMAAGYAAELAHQAAAIRTPQQAAQVIERYLPAPATGQPATPIVQVERSQLSPEVQKTLPDAPSYSLLTPEQIKQVAKDELACDATRHTLDACQKDKLDLTAQIKLRADEAEAWKRAAKGGTKLQRVGKAFKVILCAGGGGAVGALAYKQNPAMGAAVGAGVAATGCSLF